MPPPVRPEPAVTSVISAALGATHSRPVVVALLTARSQPLVEATVRADGVDAVEAETRTPLAVQTALSTKLVVSGATKSHSAPS